MLTSCNCTSSLFSYVFNTFAKKIQSVQMFFMCFDNSYNFF